MRAHALLLFLAACAADPEPRDEPVCGDDTLDEFEMCDDGNTRSGDGCSARCVTEPLVTVYWRFYDTFPTGGSEEPDCRPGVATVEVVTSIDTVKSFPCAARFGAVPVPINERVLARLRDEDGTLVAESLPMLPNTLAHVSAEFYEHAGFVRTWVASDVCGAGAVETWLAPVGGGAEFYNGMQCPKSGLGSIINTAPAGTYDLTIKTPRVEQTITGVVVPTNNGVTDVELR